ncbi:MAG TPA: hypothetical protein VF972_05545 [Actinomycetota bacterium]
MPTRIALVLLVAAALMPTSDATASPTVSCSWHVVPSPDFAPTWQTYLLDVSSLASNDTWAVGRLWTSQGAGQALAEHWDGTKWVNQSPPSRSGVTTLLVGVDAVSTNVVYAAGNIATRLTAGALVLQWTGSRWTDIGGTALAQAGNVAITGIAASAPANIWVTGYLLLPGFPGDRYRGVIFHYLATTGWVEYDVPSLRSESYILTGIDAYGSDVWAVGQVSGDPLIIHWNGRSWDVSRRLTALTGELDDVSVASDNEARAVGYVSASSTSTKTFVMHWDGTAWSHEPSPNPGGASFNVLGSVRDFSASNAWAVGSYGPGGQQSTLAEHWNGQQWSAVATENPSSDAALYGVGGTSSADMWAVGTYADDATFTFHGLTEHRC